MPCFLEHAVFGFLDPMLDPMSVGSDVECPMSNVQCMKHAMLKI